MHWKDLKAAGIDEQKLYMLNGWHEWPGYSDRERAALEWTEAVTLLTKDRVPDEVYQRAHAIQRIGIGVVDTGNGYDQWLEPIERGVPRAWWKLSAAVED